MDNFQQIAQNYLIYPASIYDFPSQFEWGSVNFTTQIGKTWLSDCPIE